MDASIVVQDGICCDVCGYPRRGLATDARCPECGEAPPPIVLSTSVDETVAGSDGDTARTRGELQWLRCIAVGLALLLFYSLAALEVTVSMPVGSFSLGTMNFPGPKLNATGPVQRSLGGQPGDLGVDGTVALVMEVAAIWLITERRALRAHREDSVSLRTATRWVAVLTAGATLGAALSGAGDYIPPRSNESGGLLIWALAAAELPANLLLYFYLRQLARQLQSRRAAQLFDRCMWLVPSVIAAGPLLILADVIRSEIPNPAWHVVTGLYGCCAVAAGAMAFAGVLHLLGTAAAVGFASWFGAWPKQLRQVPDLVRRIASAFEAQAGRWCVVAGLVLWTLLTVMNAQNALWESGRQGLLGNVPLVNFVGPKVVASLQSMQRDRFDGTIMLDCPLFWTLAAIWLITVPFSLSRPNDRLRQCARWTATLLVAIVLGINLALWEAEVDDSHLLMVATIACEVPATPLIYFYLSRLASRTGGPAATLRCVAWCVPVVVGLPLAALPLARPLRHHYADPKMAAIGAVVMAASLSLTMVAGAALLRLAWAIAKPEQTGEHARGYTN